MDLRNVLIEIHTALEERGIEHALIGGLALTVHGASRATIDLDFLADGDRDGDIDELIRSRGYECLHRNEHGAHSVTLEGVFDWVDELRAAFGEPEVDRTPWRGDDFRL